MRAAVLTCTLAVLVLLSLVTASPSLARYCGTVTAPHYHAFFLQTRHIRCKAARRTVQGWLDKNAPGSGPAGWRCRHSYSQWYRCTRRTAVIRFNLHAY